MNGLFIEILTGFPNLPNTPVSRTAPPNPLLHFLTMSATPHVYLFTLKMTKTSQILISLEKMTSQILNAEQTSLLPRESKVKYDSVPVKRVE